MTNKEKFLIGKPFKMGRIFKTEYTFSILQKMFIKKINEIEYEVILIEANFFLYQAFNARGVSRQDFNDLIFVEDDK